MSFKKANRSVHKWLSLVVALPLLIILVTGILLLIKKEVHYLQPPSAKAVGNVPVISFELILKQAKSVPEAEINDWQSISRLDVRPSKGLIKIRAKSNWEIQLDAQNGDILHVAYRRSDLIEQIHDGTYWQDSANLWFTLPVSIIVLVISITGLILFFQPYVKKWRKKRKHSRKVIKRINNHV